MPPDLRILAFRNAGGKK